MLKNKLGQKVSIGSILGIVLSITFFFMSVSPSKADNSHQMMEDQNYGLKNAPSNLGLDPDMFTVPDLSTYGVNRNFAALMNEEGRSPNPKAIRMTSTPKQSSAIWSNINNNYIAINKKQTMSMWLYFGPTKHEDGSPLGDGMAFVIQKSPDGTNAFAHSSRNPGNGQSLGVWGVDDDTTNNDPNVLAKTAIQNSWALEFDTFVDNNSDYGSGADFDNGISGQHIAYNFPAQGSTYVHEYNGNGNYFNMNHQDLRQATLTDGKWHHLAISWDPIHFDINYEFNDRNKDGSPGTNPIKATIKDVKAADFGGYDNLADKKLIWGFTATTGTYYEPNLIAFESIPSSVEGDIIPTIHDDTQNKDIGKNGSVNSGDNLSFKYELDYESGRDDWKNIEAKMVLPTNVTYNPTNDPNHTIGYITYDDGSDVEPIPASEWKLDDKGKLVLDHKLLKNLSGNDKPDQATIIINGQANNVDADTAVASVSAQMDSDTIIKDVDMLPFVIKKSKPINLSLDKNNITVGLNKDANITGTVSYTDTTIPVVNSKVDVYATLNGTALDKFSMNDTDEAGRLNFNIPASKLTEPSNTLTVYVMDSDGNKSTVSTEVIAKSGGLNLKVSNYSFGNINQIPTSMLIPRKGAWNIEVDDSRENGSTPWTLSAETAGLYDGKTQFNGNVVYKNSDGVEQAINNGMVLIANGNKTQAGEQITNVGQAWNDSEGLMLRVNGLTTKGEYSGQMNWNLSDTI